VKTDFSAFPIENYSIEIYKPYDTMSTTAPEGTPPRWIGNKNEKYSLPSVSLKGHEAGGEADFHDSGITIEVHARFSRAGK
jgi:hypothetical protein